MAIIAQGIALPAQHLLMGLIMRVVTGEAGHGAVGGEGQGRLHVLTHGGQWMGMNTLGMAPGAEFVHIAGY